MSNIKKLLIALGVLFVIVILFLQFFGGSSENGKLVVTTNQENSTITVASPEIDAGAALRASAISASRSAIRY